MSLDADIAHGHSLLESGKDVPSFVSDAVRALTLTVNDTTQLANQKYQSLKVRYIIMFNE